jgi:hypothetical protein
MPGTWVRCRGWASPKHDGIQISPDGTWRYVEWENAAFTASPGLRRDGALGEPIDTSSMNGPGFYQVNLEGQSAFIGTHVWGDRLIVSEWDAPPDVGIGVYVRTDRAVLPAANTFAAGDRAGTAACATPEAGRLDPALGAELGAALAGDWVVCSGDPLEGYARVHFGAQGEVALFDGAGNPLAKRAYEAFQPFTMPSSSPRRTVLSFGEDLGRSEEWSILLSQRPLKMWVGTESGHAMPRELMLSALQP